MVASAGNQTLNRNRKADLKKAKKRAVKTVRKVNDVADILDSFNMSSASTATKTGPAEDYDFKTDFTD